MFHASYYCSCSVQLFHVVHVLVLFCFHVLVMTPWCCPCFVRLSYCSGIVVLFHVVHVFLVISPVDKLFILCAGVEDHQPVQCPSAPKESCLWQICECSCLISYLLVFYTQSAGAVTSRQLLSCNRAVLRSA